MASTTGLAELASVCQVGLHVSLSLSLSLSRLGSHSAVPGSRSSDQVRPRESSGLLSGHTGLGRQLGQTADTGEGASADHQQPRDHAWDIWNSFTTPGID